MPSKLTDRVPESPNSPKPSLRASPRVKGGVVNTASYNNETANDKERNGQQSILSVSTILAANPDCVVTEALKKALNELLFSLGLQTRPHEYIDDRIVDGGAHSRVGEKSARFVRQKVEMRRPRHLEGVPLPVLRTQCAIDRAHVHKYNEAKAKEVTYLLTNYSTCVFLKV